ncbi:MAG TPA: IS110 family transposase [Actinomycetota bacterium]|nr:IS110 family transposase [Actinomycetota bacterium]
MEVDLPCGGLEPRFTDGPAPVCRYHPLSNPGSGKDAWQFLTYLRRSDRSSSNGGLRMEPIVERCCGLDVHQGMVVACLLVGKADERPKKEVKTFRTVTAELLELREWLQAAGCTHVGMESTGVYWKPVYALLEDAFDLTVGNAQHIKNVPGRKTDMKDAEWIADLLRHGLIRKSFVPPKPIRDLRDVVRYRRSVVQSRATERNRLLKLLETANIKLSTFLSNVFGASGMAMLEALLDGRSTPEQMAELSKGRLRKKKADVALALDGRFEEHHAFLLRMQLERLKQADAQVDALDLRIEQMLAPYREQAKKLRGIHGISQVLASLLIAEMGVDMTVFKSDEHLASWAGVCPGNHESAGKRQRGTKRKGNVHLTTALVEAAQAAIKKKGSYLRDKFHRLKARRGYKRALIAIAHKILIAAYHILLEGTDYHDLGDAYLDRLSKHRTTTALVSRLERLGYNVHLEVKAA